MTGHSSKLHIGLSKEVEGNIYVTSISYPYVGTLNNGVYKISGNEVSKVDGLNKITDIRQVCLNEKDSILNIRTNSMFYEYSLKESAITDSLEHSPIDISVIDDTTKLLYEGNILNINDGDLTIVPKFYNGINSSDGNEIIYSNMSVVNGKRLIPKNFDWRVISLSSLWVVILLVLSTMALIIVTRRLQKKKNELVVDIKSLNNKHNELIKVNKELVENNKSLGESVSAYNKEVAEYEKDPVKYYRIKLLDRLYHSEDYTQFSSDPIPGKIGELRRHFNNILRSLINSKQVDSITFERCMEKLYALSKEIIKKGLIFSNSINKAATYFADENNAFRFFKSNNRKEQWEIAMDFIWVIKDVADEIDYYAKSADNISMISYAMKIILGYEKISNIIYDHINIDKFKSEINFILGNLSYSINTQKPISNNESLYEYVKEFDKQLARLQAYYAVILMESTFDHHNFVFEDKKRTKETLKEHVSQQLYYWDCLILMSLCLNCGYKVGEIKTWLEWRFTKAILPGNAVGDNRWYIGKNAFENVMSRNGAVARICFEKIQASIFDKYHIPVKLDDIFIMLYGEFILKHKPFNNRLNEEK